MTPTPFLKKFNTQGGTLYVFPSVSRDLTKTLVSNDYEFSFSHFACINIPDIKEGDFDITKNGTDQEQERGFYITTLTNDPVTWSDEGMQNIITENLQNYVMNFETAILNGDGDNDDYDPDILTTVSEKVFWNWMAKIGAIKFNESGTQEKYSSYADRTVQYLGDIDIMNTVEINGDVFEELYIHVPSTAGASTNVYFRPGSMTDDKNYLYKNYVIGGDEDIIGFDERPNVDHNEHLTPYGLSSSAIFDIDDTNIYTGDMGHTIDFRDSSYDNGYGINNMNNKSLEDFEFNAVLIYYDITAKTNTPGVKRVATNLYGILFLDNVKDQLDNSDIQGYIQRYPKKRETVYGNGNSYALKLDLKIDTIGDSNCEYSTIAVPVAVPDDSSDPSEVDAADWGRERLVSMIQYVKSLTQLQKCIDVFYEQKNEIIKLTQRVATLENLVLGIDSVASLRNDVQRLYDLLSSNGVVDTATLLGLIDSNTKKLDNIMNGGKDLKLQFDTDVIQPGPGIGITKSPNKVVISSEQRYSINEVYEGNGTDEISISSNNMISSIADNKMCTIPLKSGENFAVVYINDQGDSTSNLNINISENDYQWEVGQSMKIFFVCEEGSLRFEAGTTTGVVIKPKTNVTLTVSGDEFEGHNLIEVVCVALPDTSDGGNVMDTKFVYLIK